MAVQKKDVSMVVLLMAAGGDTTTVDNDLEDPVRLALRIGHEECYVAMVGRNMETKPKVATPLPQVVKHWPTVCVCQVAFTFCSLH
jgi:hypothetical protein